LISQDLIDPLHTILRNVKTIYPHLAEMILEVTRKKTHTAAIVKQFVSWAGRQLSGHVFRFVSGKVV
jgi:hypothetical protein